MSQKDELLQPFPKSFSDGADIFIALSGDITGKRSERMHRHDFYELVWVREGECTFFSDFVRFPVEAGSLIFISPGQLHDYIVDAGTVIRIFILGFRPNLLPSVGQHLLNILPFDDPGRDPTLALEEAVRESLSQLFQSAHQRFDARPPGWEAILTTYCRTILTEAAYQMPEEVIVQSTSAGVHLTRAFQHEVEQHYRQIRQVQACADMLGVTSNYLVKTVRETTSMTPKQMLQDRLLLEAKRILVHTAYPINQISELLEFPNSTTFARWFKKLTSQTPTEFRSAPPYF